MGERERECVACDFASFGVVATGVEQKKRKSDAPKKTANETEERTGQDRTGRENEMEVKKGPVFVQHVTP